MVTDPAAVPDSGGRRYSKIAAGHESNTLSPFRTAEQAAQPSCCRAPWSPRRAALYQSLSL